LFKKNPLKKIDNTRGFFVFFFSKMPQIKNPQLNVFMKV